MRSRSDRKIAGICAGVAQYLDLDTSLVRILWVFITFMAGIFPGVIAYILAWIIVPEEPEVRPVLAAGQPVAG
jgi:phage shock protein C